MTTVPAHPAVDHAVAALLGGDGRASAGALAHLRDLAATDTHAALYLNVVAPTFFTQLTIADRRMFGTVMVSAATNLASALPDETEIWQDAGQQWQAYVALPIQRSAASPTTTPADTRGRFA